jgi:ankyrin repeat protein
MRRIKLKALKLLSLILALIFLAVGCEKKPTKPLELSKPIVPQESIQSLHEAVEMGNCNLVKELISDGAEVNTRDSFGSMPLHLAVRKGHTEVAELLILNGADVNTKDRQGQPVLHVAVEKGNRELLELLLANGADIEATNAVAITQPFGCMRHGRDQ